MADTSRDCLFRSAVMSGVVGAMIAFASTVTFLLTVDMLPQQLADWTAGHHHQPDWSSTCWSRCCCSWWGMFLESNAAYIMLVPLLHPIALPTASTRRSFAFLFVLNLIIGMMTPPVGVVLFVICGHDRDQDGRARAALPAVHRRRSMRCLLACIFFPPLVTWLPKLMGY